MESDFVFWDPADSTVWRCRDDGSDVLVEGAFAGSRNSVLFRIRARKRQFCAWEKCLGGFRSLSGMGEFDFLSVGAPLPRKEM